MKCLIRQWIEGAKSPSLWRRTTSLRRCLHVGREMWGEQRKPKREQSAHLPAVRYTGQGSWSSLWILSCQSAWAIPCWLFWKKGSSTAPLWCWPIKCLKQRLSTNNGNSTVRPCDPNLLGSTSPPPTHFHSIQSKKNQKNKQNFCFVSLCRSQTSHALSYSM